MKITGVKILESLWEPTMNLQWFVRPNTERIALMQQWKNQAGETQWREVKTMYINPSDEHNS